MDFTIEELTKLGVAADKAEALAKAHNAALDSKEKAMKQLLEAESKKVAESNAKKLAEEEAAKKLAEEAKKQLSETEKIRKDLEELKAKNEEMRRHNEDVALENRIKQEFVQLQPDQLQYAKYLAKEGLKQNKPIDDVMKAMSETHKNVFKPTPIQDGFQARNPGSVVNPNVTSEKAKLIVEEQKRVQDFIFKLNRN